MAKWVCNVCGYIYSEGDGFSKVCPVCKLLLPNLQNRTLR